MASILLKKWKDYTTPSGNIPIPDISYPEETILKDIDDNEYTVVHIGDQRWIVENFKSTRYSNGDSISNIITPEVKNDWFLPSEDELHQIYLNLYLTGIAYTTNISSYHSSTEASATTSRYQNFQYGNHYSGDKFKHNNHIAVRTFTDVEGAYVLGQRGPTGGWIFYIDSTTYYESSKYDLNLTGDDWSDILNQSVGGTSAAIGTGQANTTLMLAQSANSIPAKSCNDLNISYPYADDTLGGFKYVHNNQSIVDPYGVLYNWYATTNLSGLVYLEKDGVQDVGWRIPTVTDMSDLNIVLGGSSNWGKLKEAGLVHWLTPNTGATNETGFTLLPAGYYDTDGTTFYNFGTNATFWSTIEDNNNAYVYGAVNTTSNRSSSSVPKKNFTSVRLVNDLSPYTYLTDNDGKIITDNNLNIIYI